MYRDDFDDRGMWHCPDRLDGLHGEWLSMPVEVVRMSDDEYERICSTLGIAEKKD